MALALLGLLVLFVAGASWRSARDGRAARGCCAPTDPRDDLRMRSAFADAGEAPGRLSD